MNSASHWHQSARSEQNAALEEKTQTVTPKLPPRSSAGQSRSASSVPRMYGLTARAAPEIEHPHRYTPPKLPVSVHIAREANCSHLFECTAQRDNHAQLTGGPVAP
jgi:hypothetical protein